MADDTVGVEHGDAPLADVAQRAIARIIDSGIIIFVWMVVTAVYFTEGRQVSTAVINVVILALYEIVPTVRNGATLGKQIMSIEVVMVRDGSLPPVINAFLRVAPAIAVTLLTQQFFILALPFLYSTGGYARSRRGIVDRLAGTAVIKTE